MSVGGRPTFVRRVAITVAVAVLVVFVSALVWRPAESFLLLFAGVLLAAAIHAPRAYLERRTKMPAQLAFATVLATIVAIVAAFVFLFESRVVGLTGELARQIPAGIAELRDGLQQQPWGPWVLERMGGFGDGGGANLVSRLAGTATTVWDIAAKLVFVGFTAVFLAANPALYRDGLLRLLPVARRDRARAVAHEIGGTLRGWVLGRIMAMAMVAVLFWIGLRLAGVPAAGGLAMIAGLLEFIPFVGPFLAFVPVALLALTQGFPVLVAVAVVFLVIEQLEGNLITPLVQRRTVLVPPAATVAAIFVGGTLFGVVGMIVATPLVAVALVLVMMLYLHDVLGQQVELVSGVEDGEGHATAAP